MGCGCSCSQDVKDPHRINYRQASKLHRAVVNNNLADVIDILPLSKGEASQYLGYEHYQDQVVPFIDYRNPETGYTALMEAICVNNINIVRHLLEVGADPDAEAYDGSNPILLALSFEGTNDIANLLMQQGASLTVKDKKWRTPLYLAVIGQNVEMTESMLGKGAKIETVDCEGFTIFHQCADTGNLESLQLIIDSRMDVIRAKNLLDLRNMDGDTAFHIACRNGDKAICRLLYSSGCDSTIVPDRTGFVTKEVVYGILEA